jgi:hypothetical protein
VEAVSGDLSWPGLLRCWGGGPREAAEDEGLPVLLGDQSERTKGARWRVAATWRGETLEGGGSGADGRRTGVAETASGR